MRCDEVKLTLRERNVRVSHQVNILGFPSNFKRKSVQIALKRVGCDEALLFEMTYFLKKKYAPCIYIGPDWLIV